MFFLIIIFRGSKKQTKADSVKGYLISFHPGYAQSTKTTSISPFLKRFYADILNKNYDAFAIDPEITRCYQGDQSRQNIMLCRTIIENKKRFVC